MVPQLAPLAGILDLNRDLLLICLDGLDSRRCPTGPERAGGHGRYRMNAPARRRRLLLSSR
jgi:hypothetical protein